MKYFSQTGEITLGSRQNPSTSSGVEPRSGVVYAVPQSIVYKKQAIIEDQDIRGKEELTKEEEQRFYKKAFKTSLI